MKIIIERAIDRYDLAHSYYLNHIKVLKHYNVEGVSSMNSSWKYNPYTYMVIVLDKEKNRMAGAMRLEIATPNNKLPFQLALEKNHTGVNSIIKHYLTEGGVAEFCGLWVNPNYKKLNIPEKLTSTGIELAKELNIPYVVAFANNHSRPITEELGFGLKTVGSIDKFYYPDKRYETHLMEKYVDEKVNTAI